MAYFFSQIIPVTGPLHGFPGKVSRLGERLITARPVLLTTANPIAFGAPVVIDTATAYDSYRSVADFVAAGGSFTASMFAGIAVSEVTTTGSSYPYSPLAPVGGAYAQGRHCEALVRGSITVLVQPAATGTPLAEMPLYIRVAANASYTGAVVGGFEVSSDAAVSTTGTASSGSTALTVASGTGIVAGQIITGTGIASGTSVAAVSGTSVTLSKNTTAALSTTAVNFASNVVIPNLVFRTNQGLDTTNIAEVTILTRVAA